MKPFNDKKPLLILKDMNIMSAYIDEKWNVNLVLSGKNKIGNFVLPNYNFNFAFDMDLLIRFFIENQEVFKDYTFDELLKCLKNVKN